MINLFLILGVVLIIGISIGWSILRGISKARIRAASLIGCAILAVILAAVTRGFFVNEAFVEETLFPLIEEAGLGDSVAEILGVSPTLDNVLVNCIVSLVLPILCLLYFFALSFLTWIVFLIVTIVLRATLKEQTKNTKYRIWRAAAWGLGQGLVFSFICLLPISVYIGLASPVVNGIMDSEMLSSDQEATVQEVLDIAVTPLENGSLKVYRFLGGEAVGNLLTDFKVDETKIDLSEEVGSITTFACNIVSLGQTDFADYGEPQALVFIAVADAFDESHLLPTIAGEILYSATDKWLSNEPFLGIAKPTFGEMEEIFSPFFGTLLEIMHTDAQNPKALQADFHTVAEMVSLLAKHGIFAKMSDTDSLMTALGGEGLVESLITTMGRNQSMKILIPEVTNMGLRAVATTLGIPRDVGVVYDDFLGDVAGAVNYAKGLQGKARDEQLTKDLKKAFDEAGVPVDPELIQCYAVSMSKDLIDHANKDRITPEDVKAFFEVYAMNVASEEDSSNAIENIAFKGTVVLAGETDRFAGTVYAGKTEEELSASGAAVLARAYTELVKLEYTADYANQAFEILTDAYSDLLQDDESGLETISSVVLTKSVTKDAFEATAALKSSEEMVTSKVTLDQMLIDTKAAAEKINEETIADESKAIAVIFGTASELKRELDHSSEMKIEDVATSFGTILDALNQTGSVGQEKTANLFTAVMQSETVRKAADLDMATATQMAQKATSGEKVDYSQTMNAVSGSVTILTKFGKDGEELKEEDLIELIRNINPQIAGMIEVYATPERLESYRVPSKYSGTSSQLIGSIFHQMANDSMSDEQYQKEAKALNQILSLALSAKEHATEKHLFTQNGQIGVLPGSAAESVEIFLSSGAICEGLKNVMLDENGNVKEGKFDAFELGSKIPETSNDRQDCEAAIAEYYAQHHDESTRRSLVSFAALLGVHVDGILA
ncbi:MAG: hypothetical protein IKJ35_08895 [Clostridia bacterium]|nr:hypothetical protein [Clostridia bacterium]